MSPQEDNAVRVLAQAVDRMAIEIAGLRQNVDDRLRPLENAAAAREATDRIETSMAEREVRKRDVYIPAFIAAVISAGCAVIGVYAAGG